MNMDRGDVGHNVEATANDAFSYVPQILAYVRTQCPTAADASLALLAAHIRLEAAFGTDAEFRRIMMDVLSAKQDKYQFKGGDPCAPASWEEVVSG
jgi:hypothetical protein